MIKHLTETEARDILKRYVNGNSLDKETILKAERLTRLDIHRLQKRFGPIRKMSPEARELEKINNVLKDKNIIISNINGVYHAKDRSSIR